jgi:DNA-binding MurR/RpiR family transcriptional regulator
MVPSSGESEPAEDIDASGTPPLTAGQTVAEAVRAALSALTPTERKVAQVLLSNYPVTGLAPVAEWAERAGVSAPSVLRFIGRLGFAGTADFQRRLREEWEARLAAPLGKGEPTDAVGQPSAPSAFADAVARNIAATFAGISADEFNGIVDLFADPKRRIHAVGGRFTEALALYLIRHLRIVRSDVSLFDSHRATWADQVVGFGGRDVLVVFDIRRYQTDVVALAREAAARGATIVLFTDQWLSPIAQIARHTVAARVAVPSNWDSGAAMIAVIEALVAQATKALWPTAKARLEDLERLRTDAGDR